MNFLNEAIGIKDELIEIRRWLHMHPELGFEEYETAEYIKRFLETEGIEYKIYGVTGICGMIKGEQIGDNNKVIGLRADIDGLPIQDNKCCSYSSKINGKMHACGHDAHTTILLGVMKILNKNKHLFSGVVKAIFEPAEETVGGAKLMIEQGVLNNPKVDIICGLHMDEAIECGNIKVREGTVNAASNPFKIVVKGSGGHGAYPSETVDPIVVASHIVMAVQSIVSREVNPVNPTVVTFGAIHGGTAQNIIPEEVTLSGIIRTMTPEDREFVKKRLCEIVEGVCLTSRAKAMIEIEESYPCLMNSKEIVDKLRGAASEIIGEENVLLQENPKMGVESFAYFANSVPSAFYFLGCRNSEKNIVYPAHNSLFDIDEESLPVGVAIQCNMAFKYLTSL